MTVIFDLDDTLLDTVRLKRDLATESVDEVVVRCAEYLFPDALSVLERLRAAECHLVLLTYGETNWQRRKVRHAGLKERFDRLIFTEIPKRKMAAELRALEPPLVLVNDNGWEIDELLPELPGARAVAMRSSKAPPSDPSVPVCRNLKEVYENISLFLRE